MALWLALRHNSDWLNYAYATYHGRSSKTIDVRLYNLQELIRLVLLGDGNVFYVSPAHSEIIHYFLKVKERS